MAAENHSPSANVAQHMLDAVAIPETVLSVHIPAAAGQCVHVAAATGHSPGSDSSCSRVIVNNVGPLNGVIEHVAAATTCPKQSRVVHAPIVQELEFLSCNCGSRRFT